MRRALLPIRAAETLRATGAGLTTPQLDARRGIRASRRALPVKSLPDGVLDARTRFVKRAVFDVRLAILVAPDKRPSCDGARGLQSDEGKANKRSERRHNRHWRNEEQWGKGRERLLMSRAV